MNLKITLITPPDIFQNDNPSVMLMNLTESQQDQVTKWLSECNSDLDLNIYFYQNEANMPWFLHAMASSSYKYINLDNTVGMTALLAGYILGKSSVFYTLSDVNQRAVFDHINKNRIDSVVDFFERVLSEK